MKELDLIHGRFMQTFRKAYSYGGSVTEGAWHGPSMMQALEGVGPKQAEVRRIEGRHTIWEIVNHCTYWMEEVDKALRGEDIFDVETIEDWPASGGSPEGWKIDLEKLVGTHKKVAQRIQELRAEELEKKLGAQFGENYFEFTFRKMLHGISDHNTYHGGQISIMKK